MALLLRDLGGLLYLGPRGLPGIDRLLKIAPIRQLLELSPERTIVHSTTAHTVVKNAYFPGSRSLRVGQEWSWVLDDLLAFDDDIHLVYEDFGRSEVGFIPVDLGEIPSGLVDSSDCPIRSLLRRTRLHLLFLHSAPRLGSVWQNSG